MRYYNNNDLNNLSDNDTEPKAIYDKLKKFYEEDRAKASAESIALARDFINNTQAYFPPKEWREIDDLRKKARQYTGYDEVMSVKLKDSCSFSISLILSRIFTSPAHYIM